MQNKTTKNQFETQQQHSENKKYNLTFYDFNTIFVLFIKQQKERAKTFKMIWDFFEFIQKKMKKKIH